MLDRTAKFNANLDVLRTVAVACVFFSHTYETLTRKHSTTSMHFGQLGVILFFVHTSLVLMGSLERSRFTGYAQFREFFIHRFFRIYPLSVTCVAIAYYVPGATWSVSELFSNLTLTMNLSYSASMVGGLWSLPLEVQMYLLLPFFYIFLRDKSWGATLTITLATIPLAYLAPFYTGRLGVLEYMPCFLAGVVAWKRSDVATLPSGLFLVALCLCSLPWLLSSGNHMAPRWATCLLLGVSMPYFKQIDHAFIVQSAKVIAKYSYGIYLTHPVALKIAFAWCAGATALVQITVFLLLAVILPMTAFHMVEDPAIKLGRRVADRLPIKLARIFNKSRGVT